MGALPAIPTVELGGMGGANHLSQPPPPEHNSGRQNNNNHDYNITSVMENTSMFVFFWRAKWEGMGLAKSHLHHQSKTNLSRA